jgi:hypothetical protein
VQLRASPTVTALWDVPRPPHIPVAHFSCYLIPSCSQLWKHRHEVVFRQQEPSLGLAAQHLQRNSVDVAAPSASARLRCSRRLVGVLPLPLCDALFPVHVPSVAITLCIVIKLTTCWRPHQWNSGGDPWFIKKKVKGLDPLKSSCCASWESSSLIMSSELS